MEAKVREIGTILHALIAEPQTIAQLHDRTPQPKFPLIYNLALLEQLEFIGYSRTNDHTQVTMKRPVFLSEDIKVVPKISSKFFSRCAANGMMQHSQNLEKIYQQTSQVQHNMDFKETFNMLYHGVFEKATNLLIETETIVKPPLRRDDTHYAPWLVIIEDDAFPNPFA